MATDSVIVYSGALTANTQSDTYSAIHGYRNVSLTGGQISAKSGKAGISSYEGNIDLGYMQADDFISTSGYYIYFGEIKISEGDVFTDGTNLYDSNTESTKLKSLRNITLKPASNVR